MMQGDFRFFNLSLGSRLILAGSFFFAGVEIQIASSTFNGLVEMLSRLAENLGVSEWKG